MSNNKKDFFLLFRKKKYKLHKILFFRGRLLKKYNNFISQRNSTHINPINLKALLTNVSVFVNRHKGRHALNLKCALNKITNTSYII